MDSAPGPKPGQADAAPGMAWSDYVDGLVAAHGSLAAVAERLAALRGYTDDVASIERALRRLRVRKQLAGGTWGARALAAFGLPSAADERLRWMGAYHSRFSDLAVPMCMDLVRLWDRPPVAESPRATTWLALAHASISLRSADFDGALVHLKRGWASAGVAPIEARIELSLVHAFTQSRDDPDAADVTLGGLGPLFDEATPSADRACLFARFTDQRAYALNRKKDFAAAEALYRALPESGVPPFVACRRASGLAYARWKRGHVDEAIGFANASCRHAGDGGHVRLRAMSLSMLALILKDADAPDEAAAAKARADAIVAMLDDEALRLRFAKRHAAGDRRP